MTLREPSFTELASYICGIQPELDEAAAMELLKLAGVSEWIALRWQEQRTTADSLLGLHMEREGTAA